MGKKYRILIHAPVWILVLTLVFVKGWYTLVGGTTQPLSMIFQEMVMLIWTLGTFYLFYGFLVPAYLQNKRYLHFVASGAAILIVFPVLSHYAIYYTKVIFGDFHDYTFTLKGWVASMLYTLMVAVFGIIYRFGTDWFRNVELQKEVEHLALKNEINMLKSRLNPHFLFNTLNNIDSLIETDPDNASGYLGKLSDILRYLAYDTEKEKVALEKEMDCLKGYVDLQRLRVAGGDERIFADFDGAYSGYAIPPALLIPLVENVFKHGDLTGLIQPIRMEAHLRDGTLTFVATNPCREPAGGKKEKKGLGLETTKKRLQLYYPGAHRLEIREENGIFHVRLTIDLNAD